MAKSTSTFEKMGENWESSCVNMSGQRSPYTTAVPKKTMGRGKSPTGRAGSRSGYQIKEANGPRCTITVPLYSKNAAAASATKRNVKNVSSIAGGGEFKSASRTAGQK